MLFTLHNTAEPKCYGSFRTYIPAAAFSALALDLGYRTAAEAEQCGALDREEVSISAEGRTWIWKQGAWRLS